MSVKRNFSEQETVYACAQYAQLASTRDIAKVLGCCANSINGLLRANGVSLKSGPRIGAKAKLRPGSNLGKKMSAETRNRLSLARLGKPGKTGYRFTAEQRANMSTAQKRIYANNPTRMDHARSFRKVVDPAELAIRIAIRRMCKNMLNRVLRMARLRKDCHLEIMMGYSKVELRTHLETQFDAQTSWSNRKSFHLDHIVPISAFIRHGIADPKVINALCNLRPLARFLNQSKNAKYDDRIFSANLLSILKSIIPTDVAS
jgi:hypothetical protein